MEHHDCCAVEPAAPVKPAVSWLKTYRPLILIFFYIAGGVWASALTSGDYSMPTLMNHFMGGFFLVFSFFKMLNLRGFAESYQSYDVVARAIPAYGYVYPFIELALGTLYLMNVAPFATNVATIVVMGVSSIGVLRALLRKQKIRCACLGTFFDLPMTSVTLFEDLLMAAMAGVMLSQ